MRWTVRPTEARKDSQTTRRNLQIIQTKVAHSNFIIPAAQLVAVLHRCLADGQTNPCSRRSPTVRSAINSARIGTGFDQGAPRNYVCGTKSSTWGISCLPVAYYQLTILLDTFICSIVSILWLLILNFRFSCPSSFATSISFIVFAVHSRLRLSYVSLDFIDCILLSFLSCA